MVRVLHVFRIMNRGGAETAIMNIYRKIDRKKIQFDFLCMDNNVGAYDNEIYSLGGKIYRIDPPGKIGYIKHIKDIIQVCKKNNYDAIHIPTQFHSGVVCLAACISGVPIRIVHSHSAGCVSDNYIRKCYNFICRRLINIFSTDKIACGKLAGQFLFGKKARDVLILNNGINLDEYKKDYLQKVTEIKIKLGIDSNELVIGHVGRFVELKNHSFFIRLAKYMKNQGIKFKIMLVGDGELRENIMRNVHNESLEENFIFTGIRTDIPIVMNCFDVFVMPSYYEGFPVSIIEAVATGINCVVSDTISKEIEVIDGTVSFLSLDEDVKLWVDKIMELSRKKDSKENRIKILEEKGFSIDYVTKILTNIYEKKESNEKKYNFN